MNMRGWRVIEGGAPPADHEWTAAEIRALNYPTVKALPFIKLKKNAEPGWQPESFWNVEPTGDYDRDYARGKSYAVQAVAAMQADGKNVLSQIVQDMIQDGIKRAKLRGPKRRSPAVVGFLHQLGRMMPVHNP